MVSNKTRSAILSRDQRRAIHAYAAVSSVPLEKRGEYGIAVNGLGANILRCGLCGAIAAVQRLEDRGALLLDHIAGADVPGLDGASGKDVAARIRDLDADAYMIATREMLRVAVWLKRAAQATFGGCDGCEPR